MNSQQLVVQYHEILHTARGTILVIWLPELELPTCILCLRHNDVKRTSWGYRQLEWLNGSFKPTVRKKHCAAQVPLWGKSAAHSITKNQQMPKSLPWRDVNISASRVSYGPLTRYVKLRIAHAPGMPGAFSPPPWVSDPDIHHGTYVTHVPWCMPGSLTSGFLWSRWRGKRSRHSRRMHNPQFYVSGKRFMCFTFTISEIDPDTKSIPWCT